MAKQSLKIAHVFRAPLGGLFRHVLDLAREQVAQGHEVGLFFDSESDGESVRSALRSLGDLALGVVTRRIRRNPAASDIAAFAGFRAWIRRTNPDVVHGHGAKGGVYARLAHFAGANRPIRAYTPHGGSLQFDPGSLAGRVYIQIERALAGSTDLFFSDSAYISNRYESVIGRAPRRDRRAANGISPEEFEPVEPMPEADDLVFVGELRRVKGLDTLIAALPRVAMLRGVHPSLTLVGEGPDRMALESEVRRSGAADYVKFAGRLAARRAFARGRILIVPSRKESLPYIVLEAAAARVPIVATNAGGIPEIFGPYRDRLGPCDDPIDLATRIAAAMDEAEAVRTKVCEGLANHVRAHFSRRVMAEIIVDGYREALADRDASPCFSLAGSLS